MSLADTFTVPNLRRPGIPELISALRLSEYEPIFT